jgi:hypothetical protein
MERRENEEKGKEEKIRKEVKRKNLLTKCSFLQTPTLATLRKSSLC